MFLLSLAIYWWERLQDHTLSEDAGSSLHTAINTIATKGVPHETLWPYVDTGNQFTVKPDKNVWSDGYNHVIKQELSVHQDLNSIKTRLAEGVPVIFGFVVFESFESEAVAQSGIMLCQNQEIKKSVDTP